MREMGSDETNANVSGTIKSMKTQRGGMSESSTTSDNTTDFIDIVKKHDIVYNTHHPDYKNVEVKLKVWNQIAEEIGLSVDASKRKWKNLRDSYTKYLRSFRVGTKTSKKYQYWAHAEHMEFLKPYQGPGRSNANNNVVLPKEEEENECDLGYQVLAKSAANSNDDEQKPNSTTQNSAINLPISSASLTNILPNYANGTIANAALSLAMTSGAGVTTSASGGGTLTTSASSGALVLPVPSLPTVQLPPSLTAKPILGSIPSSSAASTSSCSVTSSANSYTTSTSLASLTSTSLASQVFALPQLSAKGPIPMPSSNTASSVGCLIIEPQLFASADTFKKELSSSLSSVSSSTAHTVTPSGLQIYPNISAHVTATSQAIANRLNPPLITKIRRVQPSPQSSAINLSFTTTPSSSASTSTTALSSYQTNGYTTTANNFIPTLGGNLGGSTTITATANINGVVGGAGSAGGTGPPPIKKLKSADIDISAILQANRDLDANTLFFLSLARSVRSMPTKFQALAKMRCMRIVSDIELELDNVNNDVGDINGQNSKYCTNNSDSPPPAVVANNVNEAQSEHFVYVMSPSRVESMIDLSSDEENPQNNQN